MLARIYHSASELTNGNGAYELAIDYANRVISLYRSVAHKNDFWEKAYASALVQKSGVFRYMGQYDSAYHYAKINHYLELKALRRLEIAKVVEVENRFQTEEKNRQIAFQVRQLRFEKIRNAIVIGLAVAMAGLVVLVIVFYQRLRRVNAENEQKAVELGQLDLAKSRFFANVSHELRTPLTLMTGPIQTLLNRKSELDSENHALLQLAARGGRNLKRLVNDILDLTKLEAGKMSLHTESTRPESFFKIYFAQFESLAGNRDIKFNYSAETEHYPLILLDREKCRQIVYNLLSNAFKFTPDAGTVSAAVFIKDGMLQLEVKDSGKGILPEDLPHVFDRFYQTSRPEESASGGTGIGLSLCAEYVKLFGGRVKVESEYGQGSRFIIRFPVETTELVPVEEESFGKAINEVVETDHPETQNTSEKEQSELPKVLVVEDNLDLQTYLRTILEKKYRVQVANNGKEAWATLQSDVAETDRIDLVVSDLMMPLMDGYELLRRVKNKFGSKLPFIMLTARAGREDRLKALRIGVDDYLAKPFDERELPLRIDNLLANRRERERVESDWQEEVEPLALSMPDREWLAKFEAYVREQVANRHLNVTGLAYEFNVSESTLLRQVKRLTGLGPKKYLTEVRLAVAREYLEERRYATIGRVSAEVGYADVRSFSRSFRRRYGKLPSEIMG